MLEHSLSGKKKLFNLPLLLHFLQKLDLLLKLFGRKLSCYSKTSSTGKFRSRCSRDREARRSSKPLVVSLHAYICLLCLLISLSPEYLSCPGKVFFTPNHHQFTRQIYPIFTSIQEIPNTIFLYPDLQGCY